MPIGSVGQGLVGSGNTLLGIAHGGSSRDRGACRWLHDLVAWIRVGATIGRAGPIALDARARATGKSARRRAIAIAINLHARRAFNGTRLPMVTMRRPFARAINGARTSRSRTPRLPGGIVRDVVGAVRKLWIPPIVMTIVPMPPAIVIHPDYSRPPVAVVRQPPPHPKTYAKGDPRIGPIIDGLFNIHNLRLITWNVNHVRLRRDDANVSTVFDHHALLRRVNQNAICPRTLPITLNGRHHFRWLIRVGSTELLRPSEILVHPFHDIGIVGECFHAVVPRLRIDLVRTISAVQKTSGENNVRASGRSWQQNSDERVGIERDRRDQFIERVGRNRDGGYRN